MRKHYLCRTVNELPAYMQAQVNISTNEEIVAGYIFNANELEDKVGNFTVYELEKITDVSAQTPVILLNNDFETLKDKRRPKGNSDWTTYTFRNNEVVTAIRLLPEVKLEISADSTVLVDDIGEVGKAKGYLIPVNNDMQLHYYKNIEESELPMTYLKVEAIKAFRLGGKFGNECAKTFVARVLTKEGLDTSKATAYAEDILLGKTAFARGLEVVGTLETPKITDCRSFFYQDARLDDGHNYKYYFPLFGKITNANSMFSYMSSKAGTVIDLRGLDTSECTTMSNMFNQSSTIKEINLEGLNTNKLITTSSMFYSCSNLEKINMNNFNMDNVTTIRGMFSACYSLTSLDFLSNWNTKKIKSMSSVFNSCNHLVKLDLSNWDTSSATDMSQMFSNCSRLIELIFGDGFNTSNVTNMAYMFNNLSQQIDTLPSFNCDSVINIDSMFNGKRNLVNFGGLINLGKKYTQKSANYSSYKCSFSSSSSSLTHDSLMNIINGLYDLNLSYNVAEGGTLYAQTLQLGAAAKAKLTEEEIAIATNKGWNII